MRELIKKIIYNLTPKCFIKKYIIFESNPDYTDNTKALFDMFIDKKINNKYKLIWFVDDYKKFSNIKLDNVIFVDILPKTLMGKIKTFYYQNSACLIIDENKYVRKLNKHQLRIHLMHGIGFKNVLNYQKICGKIDYMVVPGDYFIDNFSQNYNLEKDRFVILGYPRNDVLTKNIKKDIKSLLNIDKKSKLIIWLPTYRKNKNIVSASDELPVLKSRDVLKLNKYLQENDMYIVVKPHPVQNLSEITKKKLSNFIIISNDDLENLDISLYELLNKSDSLITDYSSVYFDYLLTKKIIGVTLDDINEVNKENKLFIQNYEEIIGGEHIHNYNELISYLDKVKNGKKGDSKELKKYHTFVDGNSTKRVFEFVMKKLKER